MTNITDDMVERAAQALSNRVAGQAPPPEYLREYARDALEAGLGGRGITDLPEPDGRMVRALVEHWNGHPTTLANLERDSLQSIANIREARRLVSARQVSVDDVAGSYGPAWTGGTSSVEWIRQQRDETEQR